MSLRFRKTSSLYSTQQVETYLRRISFPLEKDTRAASSTPPPTLKTLSLVMLLHVTSFPYENTSIHYEPDHIVDISATAVYDRMVKAHKGGYCMQHATLVLNILRELGYIAFSVGGFVYPPGKPSSALPPALHVPNSHMVTIVSVPCHLDIPSTRNALYLVDTGFDIQRPILIRDGHVEEGRGGVQHRLVKVPHPNGALVSMIDDDGLTGAPELEGGWAAPRVLWALQRRERESLDDYKPWQGLYVFSPLELGHQDFEAINYMICRREDSVFMNTIRVSQTTLRDKHDPSWTASADRGQHPDLYPVDPRRLDIHTVLNDRYSISSGSDCQRVDVIPRMGTEEERICVLAGVFGLLGYKTPSRAVCGDEEGARDRSRSCKRVPLAEFPAREEWARGARLEIRGRVTEIGRESRSSRRGDNM